MMLSHFSHVRLCVTPIDGSPTAPSSLGFSRQEHWSGLPFPSPMHESEKWKWSRSVVSDSLWPHGLQPTRLLRPWGFPGKSTGVGCHRLLRYKVLYFIYWFINHRKYSFTLRCANSVLSHSSLFSSIQCMRLYIYFIFLFSLNYCHYYYQFYVFVVFCFQGQNSVGGKTKIFSKFWPCYAMLSHFSCVWLCVIP